MEKIDQFSLFSVTSVGFLAIVAIPARIGKLARPYLITHKSNLTMTSALGSVFLERVFDVLTILIMFFVVAALTPMPPWLMKSSIALFVVILVLISLMVVLLVNRRAFFRIIGPVLARLPERYVHKVTELANHFIGGFTMIGDVKLILYVSFLSMVIWVVGTGAIYLLFGALDFRLPLVAAFAVMVIVIVGISIPAAPGFVGNFHFFCILGLGLFGISDADALTYAVLYHFLAIGFVIVLGLIFLPFNTFSRSDLWRRKESPGDGS